MTTQFRSWPEGNLDLLVQAAVSPTPRATAAWHAWKAARRFDDVSRQEMRVLGSVYTRLSVLDPGTPLRPRIHGILKNRWIQTQLKLRESYEAIDRFAADDIPLIVFKGGAYLAEGLPMANRRAFGDIDILIHQKDAARALSALERHGWASDNGESFQYLRQLATVRLNGNFRKGHYGNVDLHDSPFHYNRKDTPLDEELWMRSKQASLGTIKVRVPDPTDSVLIVLAHGAESANADWAIDVATRIGQQDLDWTRLTESAVRRGLVPASLAGLSYLASIAVPVPEFVLAGLSALKVPLAQRLKYWSNVKGRGERSVAEKIGNRLANFYLRNKGFADVANDSVAIAVTRPTRSPRVRMLQARLTLMPPSETGMEYCQRLSNLSGRSQLVVMLEIDSPVRSRRLFFDVCVDGVSVARLRLRAGGSKSSVTKRFQFSLPRHVNNDILLAISARPVQFLRPGATQAELDEFGPFPFRVTGVWAL